MKQITIAHTPISGRAIWKLVIDLLPQAKQAILALARKRVNVNNGTSKLQGAYNHISTIVQAPHTPFYSVSHTFSHTSHLSLHPNALHDAATIAKRLPSFFQTSLLLLVRPGLC